MYVAYFRFLWLCCWLASLLGVFSVSGQPFNGMSIGIQNLGSADLTGCYWAVYALREDGYVITAYSPFGPFTIPAGTSTGQGTVYGNGAGSACGICPSTNTFGLRTWLMEVLTCTSCPGADMILYNGWVYNAGPVVVQVNGCCAHTQYCYEMDNPSATPLAAFVGASQSTIAPGSKLFSAGSNPGCGPLPFGYVGDPVVQRDGANPDSFIITNDITYNGQSPAITNAAIGGYPNNWWNSVAQAAMSSSNSPLLGMSVGSPLADTVGTGMNITNLLNSAGVPLATNLATLGAQVASANLMNADLVALDGDLKNGFSNLVHSGLGGGGGSGTGSVSVAVTVTNFDTNAISLVITNGPGSNGYNGIWESNIFVMGTNALDTNGISFSDVLGRYGTNAGWAAGTATAESWGTLTGGVASAFGGVVSSGGSATFSVDPGDWISGNSLGLVYPSYTLPAVTMDPSDSIFAPLGLVKLGWEVMLYGGLFWGLYRHYRQGLFVLLLVPQGRTAGGELFGSNLNPVWAAVFAAVIVAVLGVAVAFEASALLSGGTTFSSAAAAFWSAIPSGSSASLGVGYVLLVCPLATVAGCAFSGFAFRVASDGLVFLIASVIRMCTGI